MTNQQHALSLAVVGGEQRATSLSDAVYEALRESILTLRDPPGSVLTENAVAGRYGVARPTAKIAVERLVAQGLLRRRAHCAAQVPVLSRSDVEDLYATRILIEQAAVTALARRGFMPPLALAAHRELGAFGSGEEGALFAGPDLAFHHALVVGHGSQRLSRMHELIIGEIQLCMGQLQAHRLMNARDIAGQHQGIVDAIIARDVELAEFLIRRHIVNARDRLLAGLDERMAVAGATTGRGRWRADFDGARRKPST
jgi:DNA-binding GntR family transcriptional regulator